MIGCTDRGHSMLLSYPFLPVAQEKGGDESNPLASQLRTQKIMAPAASTPSCALSHESSLNPHSFRRRCGRVGRSFGGPCSLRGSGCDSNDRATTRCFSSPFFRHRGFTSSPVGFGISASQDRDWIRKSCHPGPGASCRCPSASSSPPGCLRVPKSSP